MEAIADYNRYTTLMRNGFYDKLFFVDKIFGEWKTLLDFGCGDGFLTKMIAEIFPDKDIIGFDIDDDMISAARMSGSSPDNVHFHGQELRFQNYDILNLSSVIHEVYSYGDNEKIKNFWNFVFELGGFKYIVIRDMLYSDRAAEGLRLSAAKFLPDIRKWCERNHYKGELSHFEELHGSLSYPRSLVHFLLKYLYMSSPNWNRELKEDYLSLSIEALSQKIPDRYRVTHRHLYTLPYLQHKWREDFGKDFPVNIYTHSQLILEIR